MPSVSSHFVVVASYKNIVKPAQCTQMYLKIKFKHIFLFTVLRLH